MINDTRSNANTDLVDHFGKQWKDFTNTGRPFDDLKKEFDGYFSIFPWEKLPQNAEGFDAGCGNGRWAEFVLQNAKVGKLNCVEPSSALDVAKGKLSRFPNISFFNVCIADMPMQDNSQDFGYCLGVLHYVLDPLSALKDCAKKLKPGAPFLIYAYYNFENRPWWFKMIWKCSDILRKYIISPLPYPLRKFLTNLIALFVYWPLAKIAYIFEKLHLPYRNIPLSAHRNGSFYNMKNCALDRFGTCLEKRFSKKQIVDMMTTCGLENISFSGDPDVNWCAVGYKKC